MSHVAERDISELKHWKLDPLLNPSDVSLDERTQQAEAAVNAFVQRWKPQQNDLAAPDTLAKALQDYQQLLHDHGFNGWAWYYYQLQLSQDQSNPEIRAKYAQANELATKLYNNIQFFVQAVATIPVEKQPQLLQHPLLQAFRHALERYFAEGRYLLTEQEEQLANLLSAPAYTAWVSMTSTLLSQAHRPALLPDQTTADQNFSQLLSLTSHQDKNVRDVAAGAVHQITAEYAAVATEELNAILSYKKLLDDRRGMTRPDTARHIQDDIETSTVDTLIATVTEHNHLSHRYYQLKAKLMQQPALLYHERNVPIGQIDKKYPFEQAVQVVHQALQGLDHQFVEIFDQFVINERFDVYPAEGKVGGAFCAHHLITQPTYILLNHTDRLQDVLTLAHEVGHGIHNELIRRHQPAIYFDTPLSTAEVASTFMEDFVLETIADQTDPQTNLSILMMKLNDEVSSIFRQVAAYRFEQMLHQDHRQHGYLDTQAIGQLFQSAMESYMGPAVEQSPGSQHWWVYWSHLRNFFYVYSYASGLMISKSLQARVKSEPAYIEKVKTFLAAGTSKSPSALFAQLGIDISQSEFWLSGLRQFEHQLDKAEQLAHELQLIDR